MPTSNQTGANKPGSVAQTQPLDTLRQDAGAAMDGAKDLARDVAQQAKAEAGSVVERGKEQLAEVADKAKGLASEQKDLLASQVGGVVDALKRTADDLESSNGPSAGYARAIADNAEKVSTLIRDKDVDQLMHMAQDFGRRQPVAFMSAAALLGFAASRFLRASASRGTGGTGTDGTLSSGSLPDDLYGGVSNDTARSSATQDKPFAGGYQPGSVRNTDTQGGL
jgi:polyhydroxyalkanoate synthesis regulator phasin